MMALLKSEVRPRGELHLQVMRGEPGKLRRSPLTTVARRRVTLPEIIAEGFPRPGLPREVNAWRLRNCWRLFAPMTRLFLLNRFGGVALVPRLSLTLLKGDGRELQLGLASMKVVTTAGVNYLVDALLNSVEPENFKYHGFGTGNTAEANGDTALVTELTTQYATDNTRPTGSQGEGASANIYRTTATLAPDSGGTIAVVEHGIFSQAATGGGTLLDRSVFSAVNLVAGADSLVPTYDLTLSAGG